MSTEVHEPDPETLLRQADANGFLTTGRGELEAAAVAKIVGETVRVLRTWRDLNIGPPHSRTVSGVAFYSAEELVAWLRTPRPRDPGEVG